MNKKRTLRIVTIFLIIFAILVVILGTGIYLLTNKLNEESQKVTELTDELNANRQYVYIATDDLKAGTILKENENVMVDLNMTSLPESMYIHEEDLGKSLLISVSAYEPILKSMVTDEIYEKDTREVEVGVANLMIDQQTNDFVDLRIMFGDGSDYIIASKLKLKKLSLENNVFYTNLGEDEIITLAAATIDAYTITGTKIYITRYVAPAMQEKAIPNYPVRQETLNLMATDPNILHRAEQTLNAEARANLESRLALLSEEQLTSVNEGHGLTDTAHANAFLSYQKENVTVYENGQGEVIIEGN